MSAEPLVISIVRFAAVQQAADAYRLGATVDVRFDETDSQLARRVIDFATGLVYATAGTMTKLDERRFRLVPGTPTGGAGDREPRRPPPVSGAGAVEGPVPESEDRSLVTVTGRRT